MSDYNIGLLVTSIIIGLVWIPSGGKVPKMGKITKYWYKISIIVQVGLILIATFGAFELWEKYENFPNGENQIIAMFMYLSAILIVLGYLFQMIPKTWKYMKESQ